MAKLATANNKVEQEGSLGTLKSWPGRTKEFLGDVRSEMRKVTSPSRKEVQATTGVVLITVALFAVYFFLIDRVFGSAIDYIFRAFTR